MSIPYGRSPVPEVVVADHPVAEEVHDARDRVANNRRAQVPNVHLLGDIWRGVLDDDVLRASQRRNPQPLVGKQQIRLARYPVVTQDEVDEARAADLGGDAEVGHVELFGQLGGHDAWWAAEALAERQRDVGLVVGELGWPDQRVGVGFLVAERGHERLSHPLREELLWIGHATILLAAGYQPWRPLAAGRRAASSAAGRAGAPGLAELTNGAGNRSVPVLIAP